MAEDALRIGGLGCDAESGVAAPAGEVAAMTRVLDRRRQERRNLVRHFLEMLAAMIVGMVVLGGLVAFVCSVTGHSNLLDHPGASAVIMTTNMAISMVVWMRYRQHGWAATSEMAAVMYVPLVLLVVPYWVGLLSGGALLGVSHMLMIPAMVAAMFHRRDEYAGDHHRAVAGATPAPA
jgi:flagellar biosynthetic protein FliP